MNETAIITKVRRENLRDITSGKVAAIPKITKIAFGSGGVDSDGTPLTPSETQTALNEPITNGIFDIDSVTYPNETTARYTATIPATALVGVKISEAALVDESGAVCAIRNMYVKQKDAGVIFTFTFDDEF